MKIFVTGVTGAQGSNIAKELVKNKHEVVTITREVIMEKLPKGVVAFEGNLNDKTSIINALAGVEAAVLTLPMVFDLEEAKNYAQNFTEAAKEKNINHIVFNASFDLPTEETGLLALDLKIAIKSVLDESGLNVVTLVPDVYIDNLAAPWSIPVIVNEGVLPYPVENGQKIPWISHVDLGKYAAAAVENTSLKGSVLPIGGLLLTGEEIANAISEKMKKPIHFVGVTPNDFEKQLAPGFGNLAAKEISNLYRYVAEKQDDFLKKDFATTQAILGVTPQTLSDWVNSVEWA